MKTSMNPARKIRVLANITLDGVIQAPGGPEEDRAGGFQHGGWAMPYFDAALAEAVAEAQGERFDLLFGRRTYDVFAGHWPNVKADPIADGINAATKYVATHRPDSLAWGPVHALGDDVLESVRQVKGTAGPDLVVWGSTTLTTRLFEQGLVDELVLFAYPVVIGSGVRLFGGGLAPRALELVRSRATPSQVLVNRYRVAR